MRWKYCGLFSRLGRTHFLKIMLLTTSNICHYLIAKGFVSSESVVDGDFLVMDVSGRNRNFKVVRKRRQSYFVKQVQHWNEQKIAMLQCEAACYWLARNDADFAPLAPLMPEFHWYDLQRHVLITELIPESENLYEYFRRVGQFSEEVAGSLGAVWGAYHREPVERLKDSPQSAIFPGQVPWILSADMRNSHPFKELSRATSQLFDAVEESTELRQALDELRAGWLRDALMHGDMRWENCLLVSGAREHELSLKIVDWELADIGDSAWDIGSLIQAYLSAAIMYAPVNAETHTAHDLDALNRQLNGAEAALRSFWKNYVEARGVEAGSERELFERCLRYAAARMIQSAYEYVQFSPQVSPQALRLLEVSSGILKNPGKAAEELLGARST